MRRQFLQQNDKEERNEMNLEDERRLKFDRRLASRRGWVTRDELTAKIASLPDAGDKMAKPSEAEKADREDPSK